MLSKGLSSLVQHHCSKASFLQHSAFFMVQLSHQCITTTKTIALAIWTFVSTVMSLLFNMLSRLVIAFLPRSKCLLFSWLQPPSVVILEPPEIKSVPVPTFPHLFAMKWWDLLHSVGRSLGPSMLPQWHHSLLYYGWVISHCMYVPRHLYLFLSQWISKFLPCLGYCK